MCTYTESPYSSIREIFLALSVLTMTRFSEKYSFVSVYVLVFLSLVFRRKDLCEAKHDLGVRKICSKSMLYPLCYAFGGGLGKA